LLLACFWALALAVPVSVARAAEFGITPGSFAVKMLDAEGNPEIRAGAHPDRVQVDFGLEVEGTGTSARDLIFEMPAGLGGNPNAVPECPRLPYKEGVECPPDTQVGVVSFSASETQLPVYRLEAAPGQIASFASEPGIDLPFVLELRPGDYGASFVARDLPEASFSVGQIELWGVPADHQEGEPAPRQPFLTAPSTCGPLTFTLRTRSREEDAPWLSAEAQTDPLVGCENLHFAPRLDLRLSNPLADSPTGLRMDLRMPEEGDADELADASLRDATIELPPGLTVSPGGAIGLTTCSDAQLGPESSVEAACPAASKVGTVELLSPSLSERLSGAVFLGEARAGERFRMFVAVSAPGVAVKLALSLHPDPVTGALSATLRNLPQLSISRLSMNLDGGLLASPLHCGPALATARFVPYGGGPAVASSASVSIAPTLPALTCPGALPFAPTLQVAGSSPRAGHATAFSTTLRRRGGEGLPARFRVTLPAGLSAALGAIDACPEPVAGAGACPATSRVGSVRAEVGSGSRQAVLPGDVYLAGPYHRAPFSLVMAFHAALGPFDLGSAAVRATARVDSHSGRVTVATDRLPTVIEGVPIRFTAIEFGLDRPGLVRNPTSCGPHSLEATIESQEGVSAALTSPVTVHGCRRLRFKPAVRMALVGDGRLRRHSGVGLQVLTRLRRGDAGLRAIELSLPPALKLDVSRLTEICSRVDAAAELCPVGSRVGSAAARTPLLSEGLKGSIYVVQPRGNGQPDLWVSLKAAGVGLNVRGRTVADHHGRFVTRLAGLPDMPLSSFSMRLGSRSDGLLSLAATPCLDGRPRRLLTDLSATAQNGARLRSRVPIEMKPRCGVAGER
jgi:hypothetical protein